MSMSFRSKLSHRSPGRSLLGLLGLSAALGACQTDPNAMPDGGMPDMASSAVCTYEPAPTPTSGLGDTIQAGPVFAGIGEAPLDLPVGTPLGGYTARARLLGGAAPDARQSPHARAFAPSAGAQSRPLVRALYLKAGTEPLLLLKTDLCLSYDRLVFDVEKALATAGLMPSRGHVIVATSHTHSGPGTYHGAYQLTLGLDEFEENQYQRLLASLISAAKVAIKNAAPARLGAGIWDGWDKTDDIYHDRRGEDDNLPGPDGKPIGPHKEQRLFVLRVDDPTGKPLALIESFPIHGTTADADNPLISVEAPGHVELALEDRFASPVLVMHLQGPAGDASPGGREGIASCDTKKGLCSDFAKMESVGELAAPRILNLFSGITTSAQATLEVVTRTFYNGRNIKVRDGLVYAPFQPGVEVQSGHDDIYTPDGKVRNPITQFNVEAGAGLCGDKMQTLPVDGIPGAEGAPYASCADIGAAVNFIASILGQQPPAEGVPTCETTRATVTALRLDGIPVKRLDAGGNPVGGIDPSTLLLVTLPGEPVSMLADSLRTRIAAPAGEQNTFVIGYSQGHVGYILGVENWLAGGYEPSINLFGPLEGEWLMERAADVAKLALTPQRDDAESPGPGSPMAGTARFDRLNYRPGMQGDVPRSASAQAGQVPTSVPATVLVRNFGTAPTDGQPPMNVLRVSGRATFVFYGGDPEEDLPVVTIERETTPDTFAPVTTPNGRAVGSRGRDVIVTYTPDPISATPDKVTSHLWAAEWQAVGWDRTMGVAGALSAPTGRYRLTARGSADGKSYEAHSRPFMLVADGAVTVTATRSGSQVSGTGIYPVGHGFRMLRLTGPSDGDVPVTGMTTLTVTSKKDGMKKSATPNLTDGKFTLDVSGLDTSAGVSVTLADAAQNSGQIDVP